MLRVFRMWRFVRLVNRENKLIGYKDPIMVGLFKDAEFKYVSDGVILPKFRVFTRNKSKKEYIARRTLKAVIAKRYLISHFERPFLKLEVHPDQGDDFVPITGLIKGMFRELKFYEQVIATALTFSSLYGVYRLLMSLIDRM